MVKERNQMMVIEREIRLLSKNMVEMILLTSFLKCFLGNRS